MRAAARRRAAIAAERRACRRALALHLAALYEHWLGMTPHTDPQVRACCAQCRRRDDPDLWLAEAWRA